MNPGISGNPKIFDETFSYGEVKHLLGIEEMYQVNIPYMLNDDFIKESYKRDFNSQSDSNAVTEKESH